VSYTNESMESGALYALERWIRSAYPEAHTDISKRSHPREYVADLYLSIVRQSVDSHDPNVQVGLGVLFNLMYEHDKAADCFRTALQARPQVSACVRAR
jgi:peroxin-5